MADRKLPREWASEGYLLVSGGYDPAVDEWVDFYTREGDKRYGKVIYRGFYAGTMDETITLRQADGCSTIHKFTIKRA